LFLQTGICEPLLSVKFENSNSIKFQYTLLVIAQVKILQRLLAQKRAVHMIRIINSPPQYLDLLNTKKAHNPLLIKGLCAFLKQVFNLKISPQSNMQQGLLHYAGFNTPRIIHPNHITK
jgi:hypothetical protein